MAGRRGLPRRRARSRRTGSTYAAGTFVVPMAQVFARYAKDILEKQTYPEVRRSPTSPPEPPYDVSAWSLGMLLGVEHVVVNAPDRRRGPAREADRRSRGSKARVIGQRRRGSCSTTAGRTRAKAINALLKQGARASLEPATDESHGARSASTNVQRKQMDDVGADARACDDRRGAERRRRPAGALRIRAPRVGMYQPFGGGNMDEGWTRWVLEQYRFQSHHAPQRRRAAPAGCKDKFDAIILPDQARAPMINGSTGREHPARVPRRDRRRRASRR